MNSRLQIILAGIVVIGLGLFVAPMLIDWNSYRPEAEAWLTHSTGRKVAIGGDLTVRLLPQPRLNMQGVTIASRQATGGAALLTVGALDARIAVLPLFVGRILVTSLKLDEPVLTLVRQKDGRFDLGSIESPTAHRIVYAGFGLAPHGLQVDKIEIAGGRLDYRDDGLNYGETVQGIDATLLAPGDSDAYQARSSFTWAGQPWTLSVDANAPGQDRVRPVTLVLEHAAAGLKAQLAGRLGPGKAQPWQLGGALSLQLASPSVFGASAAAWGNPAQNTAAPPLMLEGVLAADPTGIAFRDGALRWGEFTAHGGLEAAFAPKPLLTMHVQGGLLNLDAVRPDLVAISRVPYWPIGALQLFSTASVAAPGAAPARGLGAIWQGSVEAKLDALVFAQGRIESPSLSASFAEGAFEIKDLALTLPGEAELHVQGKTLPGGVFDGQAQLAGEQARALFLWAGVPVQNVEQGRLMRIAYKGGLAIQPGSMRLANFEASLDGSVAKGLLALSRPAQSGPQIEADLQVTRMNVDPYRALFASDTAPLDTVLEIVDATSGPVKLKVDTLLADGYEARGVEADLNLSAGGGVTIRSLKINDLLGTELSLTGSGKALSGAASLSVSGNAEGLDLRPLLTRLGAAAPRGEAALGPATFDIKAEIKDGSGDATAEGFLAGTKAGARLSLQKTEAPFSGRLGAGSLTLDAVAQGQSMVVAGRLLGYDPPGAGGARPMDGRSAPGAGGAKPMDGRSAPVGKPGTAPADSTGPSYGAVPAADAQIPPGWVYLTLARDPAGLAFRTGAGLPGGKLTLSFDRRGEPNSGVYTVLLDGGVPDAAALFAVLGVPEARRRGAAGALALALKAQGSAAGIALSKVQVALGDLAVEGEGKLDLSGMKPVLMGGALRGRAVDLDLVRALLPRPDKAVDIPGPWSEEKLDLSALGAWDGSVTLEADSLTIGHLPFTGLKTDVALKDGQLNINELHATLFNGPLTANLALRGGTALPGLAASVKFIQLEAGNLTQVVWGKSFLEAQIQGQLSLTTQGESTAAMAASASGGISIKSAAGTIMGLERQTPAANAPYIDLVLDTHIENGVAEIKEGHVGLARGVAFVTGRAALAPYTLDVAVKTEDKPGLITVSGPLDAPKRKVQ